MHSYRGGSPFPLQYNQLRVSTGPTVSIPVTRGHRLEVVQWGQICIEYLGVYFFVHYTIYSLNLHISHDEVTESSFFFKNVQKFKDTFFFLTPHRLHHTPCCQWLCSVCSDINHSTEPTCSAPTVCWLTLYDAVSTYQFLIQLDQYDNVSSNQTGKQMWGRQKRSK